MLSEILQLMVLTHHAMEEKLEALRAVRHSTTVSVTGCEVAAIKRRAIDHCAYMAPCGSAIASFRALFMTEVGGRINSRVSSQPRFFCFAMSCSSGRSSRYVSYRLVGSFGNQYTPIRRFGIEPLQQVIRTLAHLAASLPVVRSHLSNRTPILS
jgi:hypothetical protein